MADILANPMVEQQKLRWQVCQQQFVILQKMLDIMEMADKKRRHLANITGSEAEVERLRQILPTIADRLEKQKVRVSISRLQSTADAQRLEIMEMIERLEKSLDTIIAARKAVERYEKQGKDLATTHGELTEDVYKEMQEFLISE